MNRAALIFALLLVMAGCSDIEQSNVEPQVVDACDAMLDQPDFSNLSFTECLQNRADKSRSLVDARMAQLLEVLRALETLEHYEENSLVEPFENTQKAWVDYVANRCFALGRTAYGGTGTRAMVASCEHEMNQLRADEIENQITAIESN